MDANCAAGGSAPEEKKDVKDQPQHPASDPSQSPVSPPVSPLDLRDPSRLAEAFQILIKIASRATITLDVKPEDTIKAIKAMIQDKEGLAQLMLYVRFAGKALFRHVTIPKASLHASLLLAPSSSVSEGQGGDQRVQVLVSCAAQSAFQADGRGSAVAGRALAGVGVPDLCQACLLEQDHHRSPSSPTSVSA